MRRKDLCLANNELDGDGCPQAHRVKCLACGALWEDVHIFECPSCGDEQTSEVQRCDSCGLTDLEDARARSEAGRMLGRLLNLEFATQNFRVDWSKVGAREAQALRVLKEERDKFMSEKNKHASK